MAFVEVEFPNTLSYGGVGGPEFNTEIITTQSGAEARNQNWSLFRGKWDVGQVNRSGAETELLLAFFNSVARGRLNGFRFRNLPANDYTAEDSPIGVGDGADTTFQLSKRYLYPGGVAYDKPITKPVTGSVTIAFDGTPQASGWTVNTTTGIVTFTTPPGTGVVITASYQFCCPCRFDTDWFACTRVAPDVYSWPSISIVETRDYL